MFHLEEKRQFFNVSLLIRFVISLHGKPYFLFPDVLKRWCFQKNCAGIWSVLYYWERWYFFFPKRWSYPQPEKIHDILFKCSEKMVFSKRIALGHGLSCTIYEGGFFSPRKHGIFSLDGKRRGDLSQEIRGSMIFSIWHVPRPPAKNIKDDLIQQKYT